MNAGAKLIAIINAADYCRNACSCRMSKAWMKFQGLGQDAANGERASVFLGTVHEQHAVLAIEL